MPRLLAAILNGTDTRHEVIERIGFLALDRRLDHLRWPLIEALATFDEDRLERVADDLDNAAVDQEGDGAPEFAIKAGFAGAIPKAEAEIKRKQVRDPYSKAITFALRRTHDVYRDEMVAAMRVFPELKTTQHEIH